MAKKKTNTNTQQANPLQVIEQKFARLKELNTTIEANKGLYAERDNLLKDLMGLFITVNTDTIVIQRRISVGQRTYTLTPSLLNKGNLTAKQFRASVQPTVDIE
jgi:hypothetical protein